MLVGLLLIIIGAWLKAPWWYFFMCGVHILVSFIRYEIAALDKERDDW